MSTKRYHGNKITPKGIERVNDELTVEEGLQIILNNKPFSMTMRTPGNDDELIRGLLYNEDVYRGEQPLEIKYHQTENNIITEAHLTIDESLVQEGYSTSRNFLSASSCGICGKTELQELSAINPIRAEQGLNFTSISTMFNQMAEKQDAFKLSGGCHAASAFTKDGELLCTMEDIGRHNAVDKVVGYLLNNNLLAQAKCLTVSGRISYEIVSKAFTAKIPVLAAVSAPSTLAVDFAKELGITLLAFTRGSKSTCYSHPERIKDILSQ